MAVGHVHLVEMSASCFLITELYTESPLRVMIRKISTFKTCCYGSECCCFLDNAIDPGNHHTKFEICLIYS